MKSIIDRYSEAKCETSSEINPASEIKVLGAFSLLQLHYHVSNFDTSQADPEFILEVGFAISHTHIQVMTPDHHITFTILHFSFFKESILDLLALSISISKPKTKVHFLRFNHLKIVLMC